MQDASVKRGIRWKLLITMVGLITVLVAILAAENVLTQTRIIERELERRVTLQRAILNERGTTIAEPLVRQVQNDIASFNFSNLGNVLNQQVQQADAAAGGLSYAILMGNDRMTVVDTRGPDRMGVELTDQRSLDAAKRTTGFVEEFGEGPDAVMEFTVPIKVSESQWGTLRLGYSLQVLNSEICLLYTSPSPRDRG